ncbi:pyridine nucleotide-disulfide oxidoreductase domain-containing protein 2-like [Lycorma delicatula]|uniref:pyridine nucleotide-disulfide oxidoreductase domain-containing protein 2-like n=1 Tax=Lycorma delicatula TaxID=130591 RepID=UPI003F518A22
MTNTAQKCTHQLLMRLMRQRVEYLFNPSSKYSTKLEAAYDAVIIGGGHNGLVTAAYLSRAGRKVCVLERRPILGGAAVTEEIVPGFQFSRASYVLSLLRPCIYQDLELKKHGLKLLLRNPGSYTPLREDYWTNKKAKSLTLGFDSEANKREISKFSSKDAEVFVEYENLLLRLISALNPLMDISAHKLLEEFFKRPLWYKGYQIFFDADFRRAVSGLVNLKADVKTLYQFLTAPILDILNQWFDSEPLKATLATDALIGVMASCTTPGTGYGLLHHMMGSIGDHQSVWVYPEGGMGSVSQAIAKSAKSSGAHLFVNKNVTGICVDTSHNVTAVETSDGIEIKTRLVLSSATPKVTFSLVPREAMNEQYLNSIQNIDFTTSVTKINVALSRLPNFMADRNVVSETPMPHHQATIHLNCENCSLLNDAYNRGSSGHLPSKPMVEMVLPSSLDSTIAPKGAHVCLLFTQFTPYHLTGGRSWNETTKQEYAENVFNLIEEYAPGFKESIIGKEVLCPLDLEEIFGLTEGNIFHGGMQLNQMLLSRPVSGFSWHSPETPIKGLLLCGAGVHPGGGVTGAPGRLAALHSLKYFLKK